MESLLFTGGSNKNKSVQNILELIALQIKKMLHIQPTCYGDTSYKLTVVVSTNYNSTMMLYIICLELTKKIR